MGARPSFFAPSTAEVESTLKTFIRKMIKEGHGADPYTAARNIEETVVGGGFRDISPATVKVPSISKNTVVNVYIRFDGANEVSVFARTPEHTFELVLILECTGEVNWKESQALVAMLEGCSRGSLMTAKGFQKLSNSFRNKYTAVQTGRVVDHFILRVHPGAAKTKKRNGTIIQTHLTFTDDAIAITSTVNSKTTAKGLCFIFVIHFLQRENGLGLAECQALSSCLQYTEPGEAMSELMLNAIACLMQRQFNQATTDTATVGSDTAHVCEVHPTLVERTSPIEERLAQAMLDLERMVELGQKRTQRSEGNGQYPGVEIGTLLAASGQADVFKGTFEGRQVAVKIFKGSKTSVTEGAIKAYRDELKGLLKIGNHRNVITLLDVFESPQPCIIMPLVEGGDLYDFIDSHATKRYTLEVAQKIISGIVDGMIHLHSNGIAHRDFKSPNVLVGPNENPIIINMGMSKQLAIDDKSVLHQTLTPKGTYLWMAPEMMRSNEFSTKSDIFALGIVMFEVFGCRKPYTDVQLGAPIYQFLTEIINNTCRPDHRLLDSEVPQWIVVMMQKCWAASPDDRPSAIQLRHMLDVKDALDLQQLFINEAGGITRPLDIERFCRLIGKLAPSTTSEQRRALFKVEDTDESGDVEWEEFKMWWEIIEVRGIDVALALAKQSHTSFEPRIGTAAERARTAVPVQIRETRAIQLPPPRARDSMKPSQVTTTIRHERSSVSPLSSASLSERRNQGQPRVSSQERTRAAGMGGERGTLRHAESPSATIRASGADSPGRTRGESVRNRNLANSQHHGNDQAIRHRSARTPSVLARAPPAVLEAHYAVVNGDYLRQTSGRLSYAQVVSGALTSDLPPRIPEEPTSYSAKLLYTPSAEDRETAHMAIVRDKKLASDSCKGPEPEFAKTAHAGKQG